MKKITVYNDPGHAWAAVKIAELEALDIAHKISPYSYQRGEFAYLEEDCDFSVFDREAKARGLEYRFFEIYKDETPIRNYQQFSPALI